MARELILIPKKKYEEIMKQRDEQMEDGNKSKLSESKDVKKPDEGDDKIEVKHLEEKAKQSEDANVNKNMQGGNLYVETTPSAFFKESIPKKKHVIKKKWLSFNI